MSYDFITLALAETASGQSVLAQCPHMDTSLAVGDLVILPSASQAKVLQTAMVNKLSEEYAMFSAVVRIHPIQQIFRCQWNREEAAPCTEPAQTVEAT